MEDIIVQSLTLLNLILIVYGVAKIVMKPKKRVRRWWVQEHLQEKVREEYGAYRLFSYFKLSNHEQFYKFTGMAVKQFNKLFNLIGRDIQKNMSRRKSLSPELKLAAVLNYYAKGANIEQQSWFFRIGRSTMYTIIPEVSRAIVRRLKKKYIPLPEGEQWITIAKNFEYHWNMPNCVGAIDGKHIRLTCPPHSGSYFFNYKKFYSIVLMAACDAFGRFSWLSCGDYGHLNDATIFRDSYLGTKLRESELDLPAPTKLPKVNAKFPYFFVGDGIFGLQKYLLTPYARSANMPFREKIFNYRLSRARRTIECAFGVLVGKWQILKQPLNFRLDTTETVIMALSCIHNFLITTELKMPNNERRYVMNEELQVNDNENFPEAEDVEAMVLRNRLSQYFVSKAGSVPWQWDAI